MGAEHLPASFGPLLAKYRLAAGLSQEELAERAGLSRRGISDLERGVRRPLPATARRLAESLQLDGDTRAEFIGATSWRARTTVQKPQTESNLPVALSSFVGRQHEMQRIGRLLETARLLTLTGTGGVGKTRLAQEIARARGAAGNKRVCLVELAAIATCEAVPQTVAAVLRLPEQAGARVIDTITHALRTEELLLILDNCEQVLQGCAELAGAVLGTCPNVQLVATSRERLGIDGETVWRVAPLRIPAECTSDEEVQACDSIRLFVQRAAGLIPEFELSEHNSPAVAHVCDRLQGLPLAIELAAAQLAALSVQQIAERLDDALTLLVRGSRTAAARQQTLRATIGWSYALLEPAEQVIFDRLSVFAGGWTLEAAEYVCANAEPIQADFRTRSRHVVDVLVRLTGKSLVVATPDAQGAMRYRLLETLRQFGCEHLSERGEFEATTERHAEFFLAWARRHLSASDTFRPLHAASIELDNLRAALRCLLDQRDTNGMLRLGAALRWYWFQQGQLTEGAQWYSEVLAQAEPQVETEDLGHVLAAAGLIAARQGRTTDAEPLYTRALAVWRTLGNDFEVARSMSQLGTLYRLTGRLSEAYRHFEEGARLSEEQNFGFLAAMNRLGLAESLYDDQHYDEALAQAGHALDVADALQYARATSWVKRAIGLIHYQRGEKPLARRFLEEALMEARTVEGPGWWLADALACVAQLEVDNRNFERARALLQEALDISMTLGDRRMIARSMERMAYLAAAEGRGARAVQLDAAADALRTAAGLPRSPAENETMERWLGSAELVLERRVRERVRREAATMPLERVLAAASLHFTAQAADARGGATGRDSLGARWPEGARPVERPDLAPHNSERVRADVPQAIGSLTAGDGAVDCGAGRSLTRRSGAGTVF